MWLKVSETASMTPFLSYRFFSFLLKKGTDEDRQDVGPTGNCMYGYYSIIKYHKETLNAEGFFSFFFFIDKSIKTSHCYTQINNFIHRLRCKIVFYCNPMKVYFILSLLIVITLSQRTNTIVDTISNWS